MIQERGKERAEQAYPAFVDAPDYMKTITLLERVAYERGYNDAMAEPREWSDAAVEEACRAYFYSDDMRAALIAADKAERERVQHG